VVPGDAGERGAVHLDRQRAGEGPVARVLGAAAEVDQVPVGAGGILVSDGGAGAVGVAGAVARRVATAAAGGRRVHGPVAELERTRGEEDDLEVQIVLAGIRRPDAFAH